MPYSFVYVSRAPLPYFLFEFNLIQFLSHIHKYKLAYVSIKTVNENLPFEYWLDLIKSLTQ